ncbi:MAG: hypothetical protein ACOC0U_04135 [Desulfovibrionales bacterium]
MCKRFLLYKNDSGTGRRYITWLMAGSRKEAFDFISWFGNLTPRCNLFKLEEGQDFELIEEHCELQQRVKSTKKACESAAV